MVQQTVIQVAVIPNPPERLTRTTHNIAYFTMHPDLCGAIYRSTI